MIIRKLSLVLCLSILLTSCSGEEIVHLGLRVGETYLHSREGTASAEEAYSQTSTAEYLQTSQAIYSQTSTAEYLQTSQAIYIQTLEAAIPTLTPTPTFGFFIQDYFRLALDPSCESLSSNDPRLLELIQCEQSGVKVRFAYWDSETSMEESFKSDLGRLNDLGVQIINSTWSDVNNPDIQIGNLYHFIDNNGDSNIAWTVAGKQLSGWAKLTGDNQEALYNWWAATGAPHN